MKNLVSITTFAFAIIILSFLSSCKTDSIQDIQNELIPQDLDGAVIEHNHYHNELCNHVKHLDMDLDNVEKIDFPFPDGTTEERFLVENDIAVTRAELQQLKEEMQDGQRQYRTYNLVSSPRVINVLGYNDGSNALTYNMIVGLYWAIGNYNKLNTGLSFKLTFGSDYDAADIVVYRHNNGKTGGVAGFPNANGDPYKWVAIYNGTGNENYNVNEHVIGHEIGHCIGLRHTDYATRASCNETGEGAGPEGAVHIPGTPTGIDWDSQMLACFSLNVDGELSTYDKVALEYLY